MLAHLFNGKKPRIPCSFIKKSCESDVVLVLGWTIEMYFNGGAYAPSIVTGRDGHCVVKIPNFSAFHIKMHCSISVLMHSEKLTQTGSLRVAVSRSYWFLIHSRLHGPVNNWGLFLASQRQGGSDSR